MIAAFDLGARTGLCWGDGSRLPVLEHKHFETVPEIGEYAVAAEEWLRGRLLVIKPKLVLREAAILPSVTSPATVLKLCGIGWELERVCWTLGIECREVLNQQAKMAATGKGNATKPQMVRACRDFGMNPHTYFVTDKKKQRVEASDEADSFGVWLYGVRIRCPEHRAFWEAPSPLLDGVRFD